jgi:hypothetical protein
MTAGNGGFRRATREQVKLKIGVQGPSGSGKTLGALALAFGLAPNGKVAVVDTENGSASLYADRYSFDVLELNPPYTSKRYLDALTEAAEAGYEVVILDSISHQWAGEGGILDRKSVMDARPGSNSYTNWAGFTKEHEEFKARILNAPVHVIATLRAKQDYIVETNERGKAQPKKVGLAPVQREGMEYEFSVVFELQMDHKASVSKDRTGLFQEDIVDLLDKTVTKRIREWLASGKAASPRPMPAPREGTPAAERDSTSPREEERAPVYGTLEWARELPLPWRSSQLHGKKIGGFSRQHLMDIAKWCEEKMNEGELSEANQDLYKATQLLLEDIDSSQVRLGLGEDASTATTNVPVPKPGAVHDALERTKQRVRKGSEKKPVSLGDPLPGEEETADISGD